jgi:hypothetical protein
LLVSLVGPRGRRCDNELIGVEVCPSTSLARCTFTTRKGTLSNRGSCLSRSRPLRWSPSRGAWIIGIILGEFYFYFLAAVDPMLVYGMPSLGEESFDRPGLGVLHSDLFAGSLIGILVAWYCYRQFYPVSSARVIVSFFPRSLHNAPILPPPGLPHRHSHWPARNVTDRIPLESQGTRPIPPNDSTTIMLAYRSILTRIMASRPHHRRSATSDMNRLWVGRPQSR